MFQIAIFFTLQIVVWATKNLAKELINKAEVNRWNKHMIIFRYVDLSELKKLTNAL